MDQPARRVVLTGEMTYAAARAAFAAAWPKLPVLWYRPTIEYYKEGYPTAEELELAPDERLLHLPGREATLHGDMTGQDLHSAMIRAFFVETDVPDSGLKSIWMATLDEANAGVRRSKREEA